MISQELTTNNLNLKQSEMIDEIWISIDAAITKLVKNFKLFRKLELSKTQEIQGYFLV